MKALFLTTLLAASGTVQAIDWRDTALNGDVMDFMSNSDGWVGYEVTAKPQLRSICCWEGGIRSAGRQMRSCRLDRQHNRSYGSSSDFAITETLKVMAHLDSGRVTEMLVVGDQCPIEGDETVQWLGPVPAAHSVRWLGQVASSRNRQTNDQAMSAIAWHDGSQATQWLADYAADPSSKRADQAVFWLGHARGEAGLDVIERLLRQLPEGRAREQLPFAISQSDEARAKSLLVDIGRNDGHRKLREQAWFWLAQQYPERAARELPTVLADLQDQREAEQVVFALSQLPDEMATDQLLTVARSDLPMPIRRQALFWLSQSDDDRALDALTSLLK